MSKLVIMNHRKSPRIRTSILVIGAIKNMPYELLATLIYLRLTCCLKVNHCLSRNHVTTISCSESLVSLQVLPPSWVTLLSAFS